MSKDSFKTDIIIPVYKPGEEFLRLVERLLPESEYIEKLIIINTEEELMPHELYLKLKAMGEADASPLFGKLKIIHIKKADFDHAATRRMGVSYSNAEFFIFMTDDALPYDDRLIRELLRPFCNENIALSYARQLPREGCREAERFTRAFNYPPESRIKTEKDLESLGIKAFFASDVCCAYRRSTYDRLGGLTDHAIFNEDMIYARKVIDSGYGISYTASAKVIHSHNYGPMEQFKRNFDLGLSQAEHGEDFGGIRSEGEGIRLVKSTALHLLKTGRPLGLIGLFFSSAAKYSGYIAGKNYRRLPKRLIRAFTGNRTYVDKYITGP